MRKRTGFLSVLAVASMSLVSLAACGGGNSGNTGKVSVTIAPPSASVPVNGQAQFTATVSNTSNTAVTWQVNGTAGGSAATGTIVTDNANSLQGDYTAPASVPSANNGQVTITAVSQADSSVVSNNATVTITAAQGLQVVPSSTSIPAGTSKTFTAMLNGTADTNVTWQATTPGGGNPGSIDPNTGVYSAPNAPPPGNSVTITATDATAGKSGTAAVTINFANASLSGNFAFAYNGDDGSGFLSVAGSFVTDGKGNVTSGVEDEEDLNSIGSSTSGETAFSGTYTFTTGGRGTLTLSTGEILHFALSAPDANGNAHGLIIRFDNSTASGTIDQQNTADFSAPNIINNYVFSVSGIDGNAAAAGAAGAFGMADGAGTFSNTNAVIDINDASATSVATNDTTLKGTYQFDTSVPGSGRGVLTVTSTDITNIFGVTSLEFAFYMVDTTHLKLLEIDTNDILAGDAFSSPTGNGSFANSLLNGGFAFTTGGTSNNGAFASGGVFVSGGNGGVTGGVIDINDGGARIPLDKPLTSSGYSVDANTGRITLALTASSGGTSNYAAYATNLGSVLLLELDTNPTASGVAFAQTSKVAPSGTYAVNLTGQGFVRNSGSFAEQDLLGQTVFSGTSLTGILDINNFGSNTTNLFPNTTLTNSTTTAPDANGRGTITATANTNPTSQYQLVYYVADANTVLLFDSDAKRVATGTVTRQF